MNIPSSRYRQLELERQHAEAVHRATRDALDHNDDQTIAIAKLPGDPWALRGIPVCVGQGGIGGAIPGTRPDTLSFLRPSDR